MPAEPTSGSSHGAAAKVCLVCSHGGHLTEMLELSEALADYETFYYCYDGETTRRLANAYRIPNRPFSSWRFILNFVRVFRLFRTERPAFVLSTGAEIAIPPFFAAKLLRIPTLYIECGCQVTTPSLTGRVLVHVADNFFVQWPELVPAYGGKAAYRGSLIDETPPEDES